MMKTIAISLVISSIVFVNHMHSQSRDYLKYRDDLNIAACGARDTSMVYGAIRKLEAFDTTGITKNLNKYYLDLAMNYWLASGAGDETFLNKTIAVCQKALYHTPEYAPIHWNLALAYSQLSDCPQTIYHLDLCFAFTKEKHIDQHTLQEGERLREKCR